MRFSNGVVKGKFSTRAFCFGNFEYCLTPFFPENDVKSSGKRVKTSQNLCEFTHPKSFGFFVFPPKWQIFEVKQTAGVVFT